MASTFYYWASQFATAIALKVIKYKAGEQFTFHDDDKSQRKTTTVWISGVEIKVSRKTWTCANRQTKRIVLAFGNLFYVKIKFLNEKKRFLREIWSSSENISSYFLPKCKRISLNFRAFKSKRKIENTIMTQTNLSCDNSWCACGYVFCLKIKITKVCNHD